MMWVFVYGTLRAGESNHRMIDKHIIDIEPGKVAGVLYDAGSFPYLVLGNTATTYVIGEWIKFEDESVLTNLDILEGFQQPGYEFNHYNRIEIKDVESGRVGWGYVAGSRIRVRLYPKISTGDWKNR